MIPVLRRSVSCLILLLFMNAKCLLVDKISLIEAKAGSIIGMKADDGDYYMYLGIPYGNIKNSVFGPAVPYTRFNGVFEATNDSIMCAQTIDQKGTVAGMLNCLHLNIYVPISEYESSLKLSNRPVMIWFYGGQFQYGHARRETYGPKYLVRHGVILVTINYRIGPYGFMCLDIPEVPGNQGLRDQYLAIKWVKENIQAFGGDPTHITLFGQEAGGHSIDLHLMSDREILYGKMILQGGSAQSLTVLPAPDNSVPLKMARYIGLDTNDVRKALLYLAKSDIKAVITAGNRLKIQFKPCVENYFISIEPFLTKLWNNIKVPKIKKIPVLMGFNEHELASLVSKKSGYFDDIQLVRNQLQKFFSFIKEDLRELVDLVTHFYFGDRGISKGTTGQAINFISDFTYIHPIHRTLQTYFENGAENIYFYMFSYLGKKNAIKNADSSSSDCCGASYGNEANYLFSNKNQTMLSYIDHEIMKQMTTMWTNFAKYSDPTPIITDILPVKWQPVTKNSINCLKIDTKLTLVKRPLNERMAFWDLFYKYNAIHQRSFEDYS